MNSSALTINDRPDLSTEIKAFKEAGHRQANKTSPGQQRNCVEQFATQNCASLQQRKFRNGGGRTH
eukprot:768584-Hanusia_phi.AAC.2